MSEKTWQEVLYNKPQWTLMLAYNRAIVGWPAPGYKINQKHGEGLYGDLYVVCSPDMNYEK